MLEFKNLATKRFLFSSNIYPQRKLHLTDETDQTFKKEIHRPFHQMKQRGTLANSCCKVSSALMSNYIRTPHKKITTKPQIWKLWNCTYNPGPNFLEIENILSFIIVFFLCIFLRAKLKRYLHMNFCYFISAI